jgi:hypothetical protein
VAGEAAVQRPLPFVLGVAADLPSEVSTSARSALTPSSPRQVRAVCRCRRASLAVVARLHGLPQKNALRAAAPRHAHDGRAGEVG